MSRSSDTPYHIYCKAYDWHEQENLADVNEESSGNVEDVEFAIRVRSRVTYVLHPVGEEEDVIETRRFTMKRDQLFYNEWASEFILSQIVRIMRVPLDYQQDMIEEILDSARSMDRAPHNANRKFLLMVVNIGIVWVRELDDDDDSMAGMVQATKSSIDKLEKVKIEDCVKQCVICFEGISIGSEATCMPCSQVYHGDCIVQWLQNSGCCPLCRFRMPSCL